MIELNNTEEKKKEVPNSQKAASFFQLQYAHSKGKDCIIIIIALIGSICTGIAMPLFAIIFGGTINNFGSKDTNPDPTKFIEDVRDLCLKFIYVGLGMWVGSFFMIWLWTFNGRTIAKRIKKDYFKLLMLQEQGYFDQKDTYQFATKIQAQVKTIELGLGDKIGNALMALSTTVGGFIIGFIYSWKMSLVLFSVIPVLIIGGYFMVLAIRDQSVNNRKAYEEAGGIAEEVIYNIKTISSFANYDFEIKRFDEKLDRSVVAGLKASVRSAITMGFLFFVIFASYSLAIWFGSKLIYEKEINPTTNKPFQSGDVLTVLFTIIFGAFSLGQAAPNIKAITEAMNAAYDYFELQKRIPKISEFEGDESPPKESLLGKLEFQDVSFNYPAKPDKVILNSINIIMEPSKTIAIVGPSGSGKSTIVNLIERLYEVTKGKILLDSYDISKLELKYLRGLIGYVPQEPVLFNTSIRDNIIFGRKDITDEQVWAACKKAYADEFISKMENGLDYIVGIKGGKLSGGQKQRIAIARAILTQPKILILDEATSALDNKSEKEVQRALRKVSKGVTTIIIAHRLSTILHSDKIIVLKEGQIMEQGSHKTLLELNGVYAELIQSQVGTADFNTDFDDLEEKLSNNKIINNENNSELLSEIPRLRIERKNSFDEFQEKINQEKAKKLELEKIADDKKKKLLPLLTNYKGTILLAAFFASCAGAVWPAYGILLADSIDSLSKNDLEEVLKDGFLLAMYFLALAGGSGIAVFFQNNLFHAIGEYLTRSLRHLTFEKYLRLNMGFYDVPTNTPGTLTTQLSSDTTKLNGVVLSMVGVSVQTVSTLVIAISLGFYFDWRIALINLGFLPLIIMSSVFHFKLQQGFSDIDEIVEAQAGGIISESVCNTKTIYSYNMQDKVVNMYIRILKNGNKSVNKTSFINGILFGFSQFVMFATYSAIFYAGGSFMFQGTLNLREMMRALFVLLFAGFGLGMAQQYVGDVSKAKSALVSLFKTLDEPSTIDPIEIRNQTDPPAKRKDTILGKIEFRNVSFSYPTRSDFQVFENLNFTIQPGENVAFVGYSGCGKSSIIQLIERFYDVTGGEILIDDINIKEYDLISLRNNMSLVMQEPILFKRDIIENIRYGKMDATEQEILHAAETAKISHFLSPEYDKTIIPVSGGEKQRIAIARAIIKNPKILLLDEATSALDSKNEKAIQQNLDEIMHDRTSITIAHKLSTIENSDIIFVMENGKIIEQGKHAELYNMKGKYYNLYNSGQQELNKNKNNDDIVIVR